MSTHDDPEDDGRPDPMGCPVDLQDDLMPDKVILESRCNPAAWVQSSVSVNLDGIR